MSGLIDATLIAYPLYRTAEYVLNVDDSNGHLDEARRWLSFWLVFSIIKTLGALGMHYVPFFFVFESVIVISLYSTEHSFLVFSFIPKFCAFYKMNVDRAIVAWNESQTVKQTVNSNTFQNIITTTASTLNFVRSYLPWFRPQNVKTE